MTENSPKNYFLMQRGWQDNDFFSDAEYSERDAWIYLIGEAAFEDRKYRIKSMTIDLKRGQLTASIRYLSTVFKWSKGRTERFIKELKNWDMIRVENGTAQNVLTICNYNKFQGVPKNYGTDVGQQRGKGWDSDGVTLRDKTNTVNTLKTVNTKRKRGAKKFAQPTLDQIHEYFVSIGVSNKSFAEKFQDHYIGNGWKVGKNPMKDWKATCRQWKRREGEFSTPARQTQAPPEKKNIFEQALNHTNSQQDFDNMKVVSS